MNKMDAKEYLESRNIWEDQDDCFDEGTILRKIGLKQLLEDYHQSKVNNSVLDDVIKCDCEDNNYALVEITENLCLECNKPIK